MAIDQYYEEDFDAPAEEYEEGFLADGRPTLCTLSNAVQCWSSLQAEKPVTIGRAAEAFNTPADRIKAAVDWHPWLFASGLRDEALIDWTIEHEGM